MKICLLFALIFVSVAFADESQPHPRCALMLSSDAPGSHFKFIKADGERVIGIFTSPLAHQENHITVTLSWRGAGSISALGEFARNVRPQYQSVSESFSAQINNKTMLSTNSAPPANPFSRALYQFRRQRAGSVHHELMTYVLFPKNDLLAPIVLWSERNDNEGIPPEVSIQIQSRVVFRPVFREALKDLIHRTSAFTITDDSIEEAFKILEAKDFASEAGILP